MENVSINTLTISLDKLREMNRRFDLLENVLDVEHISNDNFYVIIIDSETNSVPLTFETRAFRRLIQLEKELSRLSDEKKQIINFLK
jgi:hypothetical protein